MEVFRLTSTIPCLLVALSGLCVEGLYFHMTETERKCFIEEIPDETRVTGIYKLQLYDPRTDGFMPSSPGLGMHVEITDPNDNMLLSRVYSREGRFTFTSHVPGEHVICLYSSSTKWFSGAQLRVHFDIQVGEHAVDYELMAQKKLTHDELRVQQLLNQVEQITKEQNYHRYREDRFRQVSGSTNQWILWSSVAQVGVLLVIGFWQLRLLNRVNDDHLAFVSVCLFLCFVFQSFCFAFKIHWVVSFFSTINHVLLSVYVMCLFCVLLCIYLSILVPVSRNSLKGVAIAEKSALTPVSGNSLKGVAMTEKSPLVPVHAPHPCTFRHTHPPSEVS